MSKRNLSITIGIGAALAVTSVASGAAVKIKEFQAFAPEDSTIADGMAILNYSSGQNKTIIQVILSDFTPNEMYVVVIDSDAMVDETNGTVDFLDGFMEFSVEVQADAKGHITVHGVAFGFNVSSSDVLVLEPLPPFPEFPLCDVALRAVGLNPPQ